jgi:hypothetical protein
MLTEGIKRPDNNAHYDGGTVDKVTAVHEVSTDAARDIGERVWQIVFDEAVARDTDRDTARAIAELAADEAIDFFQFREIEA